MSDLMVDPSVDMALDMAAQISVSTSEFLTCINRAKVTVAAGDSLPVLQNIAIVVRQGAVFLETFNMALGLRQELTTAETEMADTILLVRYGLLADIATVAKGSNTILESDSGSLIIRVGSARWTTRLAVADWPPVPFGMSEVVWDEIPREWLIESIERVRRAAASDTCRPALQLIDIAGTRIRAADNNRFHQVVLESDARSSWQISVVRTQNLIRTLKSISDENVLVRSEAGHTLISSEDGTVLLTVTGNNLEYPSVEDVILLPAMGNNRVLACNREDLIRALEAVRVTTDNISKAVRLAYSDNCVNVSSADARGNTGSVSVEATWWAKTNSHESVFECDMILDLLKSLTEDIVRIRFGPDTAARQSTAYVTEESTGFRGVLSQVRLA